MAGKRNYDPAFKGFVKAAEGPFGQVQKYAEAMDKAFKKNGYKKR